MASPKVFSKRLRLPFIGSALCLCLFVWFLGKQCHSGRISEAFEQITPSLQHNVDSLARINHRLFSSLDAELQAYRYPAFELKMQELSQLQQKLEAYKLLIKKLQNAATNAPVSSKTLSDSSLVSLLSLTQELQAGLQSIVKEDTTLWSTMPLQFFVNADGRYMYQNISGNFNDPPVAQCVAMLGILSYAAEASFYGALKFLQYRFAGSTICCFCGPEPALVSESEYVITGGKYRADIFITKYSPQMQLLKVWVNGASIPVKEGFARYKTVTSRVGQHPVKVNMLGVNFRSDGSGYHRDTFLLEKWFHYTVGHKKVHMQPARPQFLYAGVANPVTIRTAGGFETLVVKDAGVTTGENGQYWVTPKAAGVLHGRVGTESLTFQVRSVPDPVAQLSSGHRNGSVVTVDDLTAMSDLTASMPADFDLDATCVVQAFTVTRFRRREDAEEVQHSGAVFTLALKAFLAESLPGDRYVFEAIVVSCPGDKKVREVAPLCVRVR
jgi:hypothetical protein